MPVGPYDVQRSYSLADAPFCFFYKGPNSASVLKSSMTNNLIIILVEFCVFVFNYEIALDMVEEFGDELLLVMFLDICDQVIQTTLP